jgi:hypothetical protein
MTQDQREEIAEFVANNLGDCSPAAWDRAFRAAVTQFKCTYEQAEYAYDRLFAQYQADHGWDN